MSRVKSIMVRAYPPVHNVHDAAAVLANALDEIKQAEMEVEAVGMSLYHIIPPELSRLDEEAMDLG